MTRAVERRTERAGDAKQELRAAGGRARVAELGHFWFVNNTGNWLELRWKKN